MIFSHYIKANSVRHIIKDHGINGETDHSMADPKDIARIGYVVNNYDCIELLDSKSKEYRDRNQQPAPMIKISKKVDGTYYVVEAVPDTKNKNLAVVSSYIKKAPNPQTENVQALSSNVRNASADIEAISSVSQKNDIVNSSVRNETENDTLNLTDTCELIATKHTATGDDIWVVTLKDKVSKDDFDELRKNVKTVGGYYSRFAKSPDGKAIPGFVFKSEPTEKEIKVFNDFFGYTEKTAPTKANNGTLAKGTNAWGEITTVLNDGDFYNKLNAAMEKLRNEINHYGVLLLSRTNTVRIILLW